MNANRRELLIVAWLSLAVASCGGGGTWHTQAFNAGGVIIQPDRVWVDSTTLHLRTTVINQSAGGIAIVRSQITASTPDGATVANSAGGAFGLDNIPYVIPAGGQHAVNLSFRGRVGWRDLAAAQVNWTGGVLVGGVPIAIPPMIVQHD